MSNIARRRRRQFHAAIRARLSAINAKRHIMAFVETQRETVALSMRLVYDSHLTRSATRAACARKLCGISDQASNDIDRLLGRGVATRTRRQTPYAVSIEALSSRLNTHRPPAVPFNRYEIKRQTEQNHDDDARRIAAAKNIRMATDATLSLHRLSRHSRFTGSKSRRLDLYSVMPTKIAKSCNFCRAAFVQFLSAKQAFVLGKLHVTVLRSRQTYNLSMHSVL